MTDSLKQLDNKSLSDPMGEFIRDVRRSARSRGDRIAGEHFEGDMAVVMGEVFRDLLASGVISSIGNSLFDVPMNSY